MIIVQVLSTLMQVFFKALSFETTDENKHPIYQKLKHTIILNAQVCLPTE